ncbi:oxidoreductase, partial [Streptomyces albidoflavus]
MRRHSVRFAGPVCATPARPAERSNGGRRSAGHTNMHSLWTTASPARMARVSMTEIVRYPQRTGTEGPSRVNTPSLP